MTRSTVHLLSAGHREPDTLLDAYHDHDRDDAVVVRLGIGDGGRVVVPEPTPSDITIRGTRDDTVDTDVRGRFKVRLNESPVAAGRLEGRVGAAVEVAMGASTVEIPPAQFVLIDVYGEEVEG